MKTIEDLREALKTLPADGRNPYYWSEDGTAQSCAYVQTDPERDHPQAQPNCIAGTVLKTWGMTDAELSRYEGQSADIAADALPGGMTEEVTEALLHLQLRADDGATWGEAIAEVMS